MFKQLKIYYVIISLPFALLIVGSAIFHNAIMSTLVRNPHPQINYTIFAIVLFGGVFIILSAHRLVREAKTLVEFSGAVRARTDLATLQEMSSRYSGDISCVLQMIAASGGRSINHQEQAAMEHELSNTRARLTQRNGLPQYLTGLLVGMGLLGTFIGLLSTLTDISTLISSFADLDMNNASPILVFRTMIERMKAPMQSMGIAFSASMFGLLGSITLGLMMVGIRRLQSDIFSLLGSEVARHIETALSHEDISAAGDVAYSGDESRVLIRIEERLAEAVRLQQRKLSSEIDDFKQQRSDMLRALAEQTDASNKFRGELQQLGRQLGSVLNAMEKGNSEISTQLSELTVHLSADAKGIQKLTESVEKGNSEICTQLSGLTVQMSTDANRFQKLAEAVEKGNGGISELAVHLSAGAKESQKLLAMQVEEQKRLRDSLDSYKIEERLAESARLQQRALLSEIEDFQNQRADMLRTLAEQAEATNNFRSDLQHLGRQLGTFLEVMEKGNGEIFSQFSELMVHMAADAKESHKLLALQVTEQKKLIETLDRQQNSSP